MNEKLNDLKQIFAMESIARMADLVIRRSCRENFCHVSIKNQFQGAAKYILMIRKNLIVQGCDGPSW